MSIDEGGSIETVTVSPGYQGKRLQPVSANGVDWKPALKLQTVLCGNRIEMIPEKPVE
jgi:hypothetical protein